MIYEKVDKQIINVWSWNG